MKPIYERNTSIQLHGPGPSDVHSLVLKAMSQPTIGHLDSEFLIIMDETQDMLRLLFGTKNMMTIPISGTGSAGMETMVANIIEPGDRALVVVNGVFGGRIAEEIKRHGGKVDTIDLDWGSTVNLETVKGKFSDTTYAALFLVHAETSTGALQLNMKEIAEIVHENNALFCVDAVTSLGGVEFKMDEWGIDAVYSGTQKCLSVPPGLSPVSFNNAAMSKVLGRKTPVLSWYFDLTLIANYWKEGGSQRSYHHTAPINAIFGLHEALRLIQEEGLENCIIRHALNGKALRAGLIALGCSYIVSDVEKQLPVLHAIKIPHGVDEKVLRLALRNEYNLEVGGGLGAFAGKAWRIGVMGSSSTQEKVLFLLAAIGKVFAQHNVVADETLGVQAAQKVWR